MTGAAAARLAALGLALPSVPTPTGSYLPWKKVNDLVFLAGQTNEVGQRPTARGAVPAVVSVAEAAAAARVCALNLLAALAAACDGDLDQVAECVQVRGFVNASAGFADAPAVINGASDLFVELWGERGRHVRTAVGVAALPKNAVVEVDAVFRVRR
jgi:enamine deaminase RidA (YjgF/YER057c/UK114 family)